MDEMVWVQCSRCGTLSKIRSGEASVSDDELYIHALYCNKCKGSRKHLLIGGHRDMVYQFGDMTLDERYYDYNTK